jgi:hypothetical protein
MSLAKVKLSCSLSSPAQSPPKHHKKTSKTTTKLKEVRGLKEFTMSRGKKTRTSANIKPPRSSNKIKTMEGILSPKYS